MNQSRIVLLALCIFIGYMQSEAQQLPLFSSYTNNPMLLGPSVIGAEGASDVALLYRTQFQGFEGAPTTMVALGEFSPEGKKYGFGVQLYTDKRGITSNSGAQLNYAYKLKFSEDINVGLGLGLAVDQWGFDNVGKVVEAVDDPSLMQANQRVITMRADFGAHLDYKNLFVSFSVPRSLSNDVQYTSAQSNTELSTGQLRQFTGFASYKLDVSDKVSLTPSAMVRMAGEVKPQYDLNMKLDYAEKLFATLSYRQGYALSLGGGVMVNNRLKAGYSYDMGVNGLQQYSIGSHELFIGFRINRGYNE